MDGTVSVDSGRTIDDTFHQVAQMMTDTKKDQIRALLKSIETGDPGPIAVVNEAKYIQHNPQTHEGGEGLVALFQRPRLAHPP